MLERFRKAKQVLEEARAELESVRPRAGRSVGCEAVLAVLEPESGRFRFDNHFDLVLAGALMAELVHEGRLEVSGEAKKRTVSVVDRSPVGDPELDDALLAVATGVVGSKVHRLLHAMPPRSQVVGRLVREGTLVEEKGRALGLVPVRRHRAAPGAGLEDLRQRLVRALRREDPVDDRTALLLALLDAGAKVRYLVPRSDRKVAEARASQLHDQLGEQERSMVVAVQEAVARANAASG